MPQDGRQQGAYPSEAAESPLSERAALALGRESTLVCDTLNVSCLVWLMRLGTLIPCYQGGVEARKSIQQTGSAWLIHTLETHRFGGDG